eukprot:scaffold31741_cov66-Phaeocystis_antarctica.AAC.4
MTVVSEGQVAAGGRQRREERHEVDVWRAIVRCYTTVQPRHRRQVGARGVGLGVLGPRLGTGALLEGQVVAHGHGDHAHLAARQLPPHVPQDPFEGATERDGVVRLEEGVAVVDGELDEEQLRRAGDHPVRHQEGHHLRAAVAAEGRHLLACLLLCDAAAEVAHTEWRASGERRRKERQAAVRCEDGGLVDGGERASKLLREGETGRGGL